MGRKRALDILASVPRVSLKKLKQILEFGAAGETPDSIFRELKSCVDIHTPVGPLLLELSLPMVSGCYTWTVCNPFALLYILCSESLKFGCLLRQHLRQESGCYNGSLCIYSDEATHGNQLRHDTVNTLQCIYWCVTSLPSWFRRRKRDGFTLVILG